MSEYSDGAIRGATRLLNALNALGEHGWYFASHKDRHYCITFTSLTDNQSHSFANAKDALKFMEESGWLEAW